MTEAQADSSLHLEYYEVENLLNDEIERCCKRFNLSAPPLYLSQYGPAFELGEPVRYGCCHLDEEGLVEVAFLESTSAMVEIVRHEAAHSIAWRSHGCCDHGLNWQVIAQGVGCSRTDGFMEIGLIQYRKASHVA